MTNQSIEPDSRRVSPLDGKVAWIVGGYGAIGASISTTLAEAGATCLVAGRNIERARALADELGDRGYSAEGLQLDACNCDEVREQSNAIAQQYGSIDILVNCLGSNKEQTILDVTEEAFDEVYSKTLRSAMFLAQAAARQQVGIAKGGSHIHLLSVRSSLAFRNRGYSAFCAAKGGLAVMLKQHAIELAACGITVNGIAPGMVRTHKNEAALSDPVTFQKAIADIPLGRLATPADVAGAVYFLASPLSRFVTGQILYLDGGLTASS